MPELPYSAMKSVNHIQVNQINALQLNIFELNIVCQTKLVCFLSHRNNVSLHGEEKMEK